jgi:hypothetical protein
MKWMTTLSLTLRILLISLLIVLNVLWTHAVRPSLLHSLSPTAPVSAAEVVKRLLV